MSNVLDQVVFLVGDANISINPTLPYDDVVCEFLNELSIALLANKLAKEYPDIITFAFWCRKSNLIKLKNAFNEQYVRLGRGLIFHIAPSNVPINFAFSYVFGLLAGNGNIVRIPTRDYPQINIITAMLNDILLKPEFIAIKQNTAIVRYLHNESVTAYFSSLCDGRIIWGGDNTIRDIRKCEISPNSIELTFPDRYSFSVICSNDIMELDDKGLIKLANNFYNDTYLNDQNACSAPHLIIWTGEFVKAAKSKFWEAVFQSAKKYDLASLKVIDKYLLLCRNAIDYEYTNIVCMNNLIYRVELTILPENLDKLRGKFGFFYEYETNDINMLSNFITKKYQTVTYFGNCKMELLDFVKKNHLQGIDRIVPIGSAMDIGVIWDGYDLIRYLSRIVHVV